MSDNKGFEIMSLRFEDIKQPIFKEAKGKPYIIYGENNAYPNYLLDLYNKSAKHSAVVRGKVDYIIGNGFAVKEEAGVDAKAKAVIDEANTDGESLNEVVRKAVHDLELFGGAYLEVIYSKKKTVAEVRHLHYSNVRASKDLSKFYYSEEWTKGEGEKVAENSKPDFEEIPAFDRNRPGGKQIVFIREYTPALKTYPLPNYFGCLRYISVDIAISEYHLNGISNGMFSSKLINFNNGIPAEPEQKEIEKKVNTKFAGAKNAGKVLVKFNKSKENETTVLDLSGTELDKHFDLLNKTVQTEIFSGHRITSPMLFGIKTEGQLGGRSELREAFELFQNTYINAKQQLIERYVNLIYSFNKIAPLYIQRSEPIGHEFSEATIAKAMTDDEIRERLGLKPRNQQTPATPAAPTGTPAGFKSDDLDDEADIKVISAFGRKRVDFDVIESRTGFEFAEAANLSAKQKKIIELIGNDPLIDTATMAEALSVSEDVVKGLLKGLERDGLINVSNEGEGENKTVKRTVSPDAGDVIDNGGGETTSIKVMYSYEGPKDSRNRPFCAKMLEMDKLFTRQEIEAISARIGYSVWDRRGGWYRPAGSSEARPYCRHTWATNTVIEKTK